jgi:hypothetical protein
VVELEALAGVFKQQLSIHESRNIFRDADYLMNKLRWFMGNDHEKTRRRHTSAFHSNTFNNPIGSVPCIALPSKDFVHSRPMYVFTSKGCVKLPFYSSRTGCDYFRLPEPC